MVQEVTLSEKRWRLSAKKIIARLPRSLFPGYVLTAALEVGSDLAGSSGWPGTAVLAFSGDTHPVE